MADYLVTWLSECLAALDAAADAARTGVWSCWSNNGRSGWVTHESPLTRVAGSDHLEFAAHIALHDPRAVRARLAAERAVLDEHHNVNDGDCAACVVGAWGYPTHGSSRPAAWPCATICLIAHGHRFDAPGWRDEWAPDDAGRDLR